MNAAVYVDETC